MTSAPNARQVALDLIGAVLRRKRPLDDAIEDNGAMTELAVRDRPRMFGRSAGIPAFKRHPLRLVDFSPR